MRFSGKSLFAELIVQRSGVSLKILAQLHITSVVFVL